MDKKGMLGFGNRSLSRRDMLKLMGTTLGAAVLVGCAPKATPPAATEEAPVPVTLRYQNHWSKDTDAHVKGMEWLYKEFKAKYPDITIENVLNPDSQESYKKITADCAAGDCPDIIHGPGPEMWDRATCLI